MEFPVSSASEFNSIEEPFKNEGFELLDVEDAKYSIGKEAQTIFFAPKQSLFVDIVDALRCVTLRCS